MQFGGIDSCDPECEKVKITLFKNGRMLIKNIDEKKAYEKYTELIKKLKIKC